jgi:hypothetical protein
MIEQGGTAKVAFDTISGTIDSMTKTAVFSLYELILVEK